MAKAKGVSRSVRVSSVQGPFSRGGRRTTIATSCVLGPTAIVKEQADAQKRFALDIAGLGSSALKQLQEVRGSGADEVVEDTTMAEADTRDPEQWEDMPEGETFAHAVRDVLETPWAGRCYGDNRTWRQRIQRLHLNWEPLMEILADAYLRWKYPSANGLPAPLTSPPLSGGYPSQRETTYDFVIAVIDIYSLEQERTILRSPNSTIAQALVSAGYLGCSPEQPSMAISLKTLELFRRLRLRKASFSIEAFAKVICDLYIIPFRRIYRTALSNAFDAYTAILRRIDRCVAEALGQQDPDYRVLNACPACCYELEGEAQLKFTRMLAIDANFSLKRIAPGVRQVGDQRTFEESNYYLPTEFVDRFAQEVKSRPQRPGADLADDGDWDITGEPEAHGDPTDHSKSTSTNDPCTDRWKAAAGDEKKKMWAIFEESGLFASACRHGMILWIADMVRSGELAKFPLAVIAKALETLPPRWLVGYDIGCAFSATIASSSLGPSFEAQECRCCVNAFHGYSHSFDCQKKHHPNVIDGVGLEDLETLERVFSASNQMAVVTRYMSKYRRRMFIDMFFQQWDTEKYTNLGTMLHNNYVQALRILDTDSVAFAHAKATLNISDEDLERWQKEEVEYFSTLGQEPEYDILRTTYVGLLREMRDLSDKFEHASSRFLTATPAEASQDTYASALSQTRRLETEWRYASERHANITREVIALEVKLGIQSRWAPSSPEYQQALLYMNTQNYHRALDRLQRLVVQRLFELQKLNLSFTGYRMRTHIAKSLQTRCKAIRNAVKQYNIAAESLDPPRPKLDWSHVSHYSFLEEFNLLRDTRHDICEKPWANLVIREAMKQQLRLKRAHEEIERCNIEIRRLQTAIYDEEIAFCDLLVRLSASGSDILGAVEEHITRRRRINQQILARISQTHALKGFSGTPVIGRRKGSPVVERESPEIDVAREIVELDAEDGGAMGDLDDDDEEVSDDIGVLVDYISELPSK